MIQLIMYHMFQYFIMLLNVDDFCHLPALLESYTFVLFLLLNSLMPMHVPSKFLWLVDFVHILIVRSTAANCS